MAEQDNKALAFDASKVKLGTNYLLVGSDAYLIDSVIKQITLVLKKKEDIDVSTVYGDEVKAGELGEYLDTFTIFSSAKLVIVKKAEKMLKKELEVVADYFESPSDIQCLIVVTEKTDAKYNAWKKIISGSQKVQCDPPKFVSEIRNWLLAELSKEGKSMNPAAINEFSDRIEMDYFSAANELTKLLLLVGDRKQITQQDLNLSLSGNRAGTQIDFFRALGRRNIKIALESCTLMLQADVEPLQIFFGLYRFYLNLYRVNLMREKHLTDNEIAQKHMNDVFYSQRKEYLVFAKNYSLKALESIFGVLLETDSLLKSSLTDKTLQIELCIIQACDTK